MVKQQCLFGILLTKKVPGRHFLVPESWRKGVKKAEQNRQSGENENSLEDGILHHQENVDLLPVNIELSALEVTMGNVMSREMIMKEYIDVIRSRYDYIRIDCMPSLGMMTIDALVSSDSVLLNDEYIEGIFVADEMQSCGIGKLLLDYIKDKKVRLQLNVYQKNARAISFYQREGFIIQCEGLDEATGEKEYTMLWKQK